MSSVSSVATPSLTPFEVGSTATVALDGAIAPIHGTSLRIGLGDKDYVQWKMASILNDLTAPSIPTSPSYYLRMLARPNIAFTYYNLAQADLGTITTSTGTAITPLSGSLFINERLSGYEDDYRFITYGNNLTLSIDEVRSVRADIDPFIRLLLRPIDPAVIDHESSDPLPALDPAKPTLVPGQYEFSVWMKLGNDDKRFDDDTRTNEPYASYYVTLRIRQVDGDLIKPIRGNSEIFAVDSNWNRLAIRMEKPENMDTFDEDSEYPVMELAISPTRIDAPDAGAVLIAAPALNFYLYGF